MERYEGRRGRTRRRVVKALVAVGLVAGVLGGTAVAASADEFMLRNVDISYDPSQPAACAFIGCWG